MLFTLDREFLLTSPNWDYYFFRYEHDDEQMPESLENVEEMAPS